MSLDSFKVLPPLQPPPISLGGGQSPNASSGVGQPDYRIPFEPSVEDIQPDPKIKKAKAFAAAQGVGQLFLPLVNLPK